MFACFERISRRLYVGLAVARRVDGKPVPKRLGQLGSVLWSEPISVAERVRFWAQFDARLDAIAARHPGVVSRADAEKVREMVARRVPPPRTEDELRRQRTAIALADLVDALGQYDGNEAFTDALAHLVELARENQRQPERSKASNRKEQAG